MFVKILLLRANFWDLLSQMSLFAWIIISILLFMSLVSWGIIINKWRVFRRVNSDNQRFLQSFRRQNRLRDAKAKLLAYKRTPLASMFEEGYREFERLAATTSEDALDIDSNVKLSPDQMEAVDRVLEREANVQVGQLERSVSFLATTGNVAPFFGLLGTCWGIMYAFLDIGVKESASLIVVAPGIAEALVATIFGLAVAIPAVIGFNWCNTKLKFFADDLHNFASELMAAISRGT
jgi:biopolymer transport protein TolQ